MSGRSRSNLALPVVIAVLAGYKGGHGLIRTPRLQLVVGGLPGLALAALEHSLVVFILGIQSLSVELPDPERLLGESIGTPGVQFGRTHIWDIGHLYETLFEPVN